MPDFNDILKFWFNGVTDETLLNKKNPPVSLWFNGGRAFDEEIRQKFLADYEKARAGEFKDWEATARGRLALILIFDQFARNMFRNTPQAFETDGLALDLSRRSIEDGIDQELQLIERVFLYMPLMHAESLSVQEQSVRLFQLIVDESKTKAPQNTPYFQYNRTYAQSHRDAIAQFGRFPHRNKILNRISTPQEVIFLGK